MFKKFSLRKAKRLFKEAYAIFARNKDRMKAQEAESYLSRFRKLKESLAAKDAAFAEDHALTLHRDLKKRFPKSLARSICELIFAIAFALVFATIVRQMWFEPMEIPTGSMRPTLCEQDRLIVGKTNFGLNIPLIPSHFAFDSSLVKRGEIIVFTVENMDVADSKTTYFYLFPGYKRFVKRCLGKGGDTLYFYGGQIYGIDKEGNDLATLREDPLFASIDHVPFIKFEGKMRQGSSPHEIYFYQMNQLIGRLTPPISLSQKTELIGDLLVDGKWRADTPGKALEPHDTIVTYSDFWGMGNYAFARLLTKTELPPLATPLDNAPLYLEMRHHPSLTYPYPHFIDEGKYGFRPQLTPQTSLLALDAKHLQALWKSLYTSRFYIKDEKAYLYTANGPQNTSFAPSFPKVPDGCYEFNQGVAYRIDWGGVATPLPFDHSLYEETPENLQGLFNLGIAFHNFLLPKAGSELYPERFAYFRAGDLYVMGGKIIARDDPALQRFVANELHKQEQARPERPYLPFIDRGPPLKNGRIDKDFIKAFGLTIPEHSYLALGDNYAVSGDSREFGFVPENNLEGSPWFLLWPAGSRWGLIAEPSAKGWSSYSFFMLGLAVIIFIFWTIYKRTKYNRILKEI